MPQMSDPQITLKRLEEIYEKIEELYETVDLINQIRANFDSAYHEAKYKIREIEELEESYKNSVSDLSVLTGQFQQEKKKIQEALKPLRGERKSIEEIRQIIDDAMSHIDETIADKAAYFAAQMENLISESQDKTRQIDEDTRDLVQERLTRLTEFMDASKEKINTLNSELEVFKNHVNEYLSHKLDELSEEQSAMNKEMSSRFFKKTKILRDSLEAHINTKIDEFLNRQNTLIHNLTQQIDGFERIISVVKTEQREIEEEQKRGFSEILQSQDENRNIFQNLEERIKVIERKTTPFWKKFSK